MNSRGDATIDPQTTTRETWGWGGGGGDKRKKEESLGETQAAFAFRGTTRVELERQSG